MSGYSKMVASPLGPKARDIVKKMQDSFHLNTWSTGSTLEKRL